MQFDEIMSSLASEKQQSFYQKNDLNNYLLKLKKDYEKFLSKYESINTYTVPSTVKPNNVTNNNSEPCNMPSQLGTANNNNNLASITSIEARSNELINTINQLIPCIGCRAAVERFYKQLIEKQSNSKRARGSFTLDPFLINSNGNISLKKNILLSPMSVFKIFYING